MDITISDISKKYGEVTALHPSSLQIHSGEFISLLGPSGCGKTTLLNLLAGLETPDSGSIFFGDKTVFDNDARKNLSAEKRNIGMVFQDFALWPHMTVFENVAFGLRARRQTTDLKENVLKALERVRLTGFEKRYPAQLSGGQQQRVSIARAIATSPGLILLDEPLSALDALLKEELKVEILNIVRDLKLTLIYVTHDQSEAMSMSDRVVVMNEGRIIQQGSPEELYNQPSHPFCADFIGKMNIFSDHKETLMIRPENLRLAPSGTGDELVKQCYVDQVCYLGDRYELFLSHENRIWRAYSDRRPEPGAPLNVYMSKDHIKKIQ